MKLKHLFSCFSFDDDEHSFSKTISRLTSKSSKRSTSQSAKQSSRQSSNTPVPTSNQSTPTTPFNSLPPLRLSIDLGNDFSDQVDKALTTQDDKNPLTPIKRFRKLSVLSVSNKIHHSSKNAEEPIPLTPPPRRSSRQKSDLFVHQSDENCAGSTPLSNNIHDDNHDENDRNDRDNNNRTNQHKHELPDSKYNEENNVNNDDLFLQPKPTDNDNLPSPVFKLIDRSESPKRAYSPLPVSSESLPIPTDQQEPNQVTRIWTTIQNNLQLFKGHLQELQPNKALFIRETFNSFDSIDDCKLHDTEKVVGRRSLLFDWVYAIIDDLNSQQIAPERSACLESLAVILESKFLSSKLIASYAPQDEDRMCKVLADVVKYSLAKLNSRGVFQNTIFYCGRYFAIAFFRLPGTAQQLLQPLDVPPRTLAKLINDSGWDYESAEQLPSTSFASFLQHLCIKPSKRSNPLEIKYADEAREYIYGLHETKIPNKYLILEPDNWLRRWTSDDSELFFSFIRAYHRLLERFILEGLEESKDKYRILSTKFLFNSPGYPQLSCILHSKILSLVRGDIYSVTTGTPSNNQKSTDISETANVLAATAGKPKLLEQANRRIVLTLQDMLQNNNSTEVLDGKFTWLEVVNFQIKLAVRLTNMYSAPQVFCLLDALDGIFLTAFNLDTNFEQIDIQFVLEFIAIILKNCDHVLTLIRVISFIFTHFDSLCQYPQYQRKLCLDLLLEPSLFNRLTLFWSQSVRSYWLRLLVFRVGHVQQNPEASDLVIEIIKQLNRNLNTIKRRHEDIEPSTRTNSVILHSDEEDVDDKRNSIIESSDGKNQDNNELNNSFKGLGLDNNNANNLPSTPKKKSFSFELQTPPKVSASNQNSPTQSPTNTRKSSADNGNIKPSNSNTTLRTLLPKPASLLLNGKDLNSALCSQFYYNRNLHIYATKALMEYSNIIEVEYQFQDWQSKLVPRLVVQWPAAFTFD
ncbi:DUF1765-domain-containing protein [Wallemia mellicola]|nr:DUF1765-domain-containing protein [Wallemia mellicola]